MIEVEGNEYHTLRDELYVNGGARVLEVYANGAKVYPERERIRFTCVVPETRKDYYLSSYFLIQLPSRKNYTDRAKYAVDYAKAWTEAQAYVKRMKSKYGMTVSDHYGARNINSYGTVNYQCNLEETFERKYSGSIEVTVEAGYADFYIPRTDRDLGKTMEYVGEATFGYESAGNTPQWRVNPGIDYWKQPFVDNGRSSGTHQQVDVADLVQTRPCVAFDRPIHITASGTASCFADFHEPDRLVNTTKRPAAVDKEALGWATHYNRLENPKRVSVDTTVNISEIIERSDNYGPGKPVSLLSMEERYWRRWRDYVLNSWYPIADNLLIRRGTPFTVDGAMYMPIGKLAVVADPPVGYEGGLLPLAPGSLVCIFDVRGYAVEYYLDG